MKKLLIFTLAVFVVLAMGCGKSDNPGSEGKRDQDNAKQSQEKRSEDGDRSKRGERGKSGEEEIDVDKLNIPEQMKEAIKSGKIPPEKVKEFLERARGGGGDAPVVNVAEVNRKNLNSYLILNGIVEPERKVEIYSRLSAYVKSIVKEEGAYVKNNEILALLDNTEIKISYEQAKIQLEQARLSYEESQANFVRNQQLREKGLISVQEFQTSEATNKQRKLDYDNSLESFKDLDLQLNWTKIRSLSEGYITERLIEMGDKVNQNQQVYTIEDFSPLLIRVFVPTSDSIKLKTGMNSEITTEVLKGAMFDGNIKLINPRIDVQTGTVKVTVEVYDKTLQLKPGMFVEVRIVIGQKEDVLVVPRKAILYKQNKTFVFVLNRGQVAQREVALGLAEEDQVEIVSGVEEGDVIVTVGVENIKDGQRVEVVR
jgi:membrane fusion protein (multidrug efflux system)